MPLLNLKTIERSIYPGEWLNKSWYTHRRRCYTLQFSPVTQPRPTLSDPMHCSTPGFPVRHQLPELAQTHVHPVSDARQPSHPL